MHQHLRRPGPCRRTALAVRRTVRFSYLQGRVTSVSDTDGGNANTWIADRNGRVVGIVDAEGARQSMSYDRHGHLVSVTERDGSVTVHGYDDRGRRTRTVTPDGADVTYAHDDQDRTTTVVTADGGDRRVRVPRRRPRSVGHHRSGRRTDAPRVAGRTADAMHGSDRRGRHVPPRRTRRPRRDRGCRRGNGALRPRRSGTRRRGGHPLGARTSYRYDSAGLLTAREAPDGGVWRFDHDDAGRVIASTDPTGARTAVEYGAHGEITATTDRSDVGPPSGSTSSATSPR